MCLHGLTRPWSNIWQFLSLCEPGFLCSAPCRLRLAFAARMLCTGLHRGLYVHSLIPYASQLYQESLQIRTPRLKKFNTLFQVTHLVTRMIMVLLQVSLLSQACPPFCLTISSCWRTWGVALRKHVWPCSKCGTLDVPHTSESILCVPRMNMLMWE